MKRTDNMTRVTSKQYDMAGHGVWRVLRQDIVSRLMPFGNFGGGPNLKYLLRMIALHSAGAPFFALMMRLHSLRMRLRSFLR